MAKQIIEGKVRTTDSRVFTIQAVTDAEEEILLDFGAAVEYKVVKLDIAGLPDQDTDRKKIGWINNFGIMDSAGNYLENVDYTVFLPAHANATFVYYDRGGLKRDKTPASKGTRRARAGMVQVDLNTGDPGIGWT